MAFTLTGDFTSADGSKPSGLVTLAWAHPNRATDTVLSTQRRELPVAAGVFSVSVPVPAGLTSDPLLMVDVKLDNAPQDIRYYAVPKTQTGTVKLSSLTPTEWPQGWLVDLSEVLAGAPGVDGVSVVDAAVVGGNLVLTMSDASTIDAGPLPSGGGGSGDPEAVADAITAHDADTTAHPDIRALIGSGGGGGAPTSRLVNAGTGLSGGGDLSADRTLSVVYGTSAGTAAQGNDGRLWDSRTPTPHGHAAGDVTGLAAVATSGLLSDLSGTITDAMIPAGIARDAEVTAASTADRDRANHTGTQTSATITDLREAVEDIVANLIGAGSNVLVTYDDAAGSLEISATAAGGTGLDAEQVRDAIGVALVGVGNVAVAVNDAADTITISTTATANSTDAALRDRASHTGTQDASTVTGLSALATSSDAANLTGTVADARIPAGITRDAELATVATTGAYTDLTGRPTVPDSPDDIGAAAASHTHAIADLPVAVSGTSSTTQLVRADDSRLSNSRTPTTHAHAIADLPVATSGTSSATHLVRADDSRLSDSRTPTDSSVTNANVASGAAIAEAKLSLASDAAAGTASRRTLGTGATQAAAGNDSRITGAVQNTQRGPIGGVQTLTYAATVTPDASLGTHFRCTMTGAMTINVPTGGTDGQRILYELTASGAQRVVTFAAGYELGENVTSRTVTIASGLTAYVGVINRGGTYRLLAVDDGS